MLSGFLFFISSPKMNNSYKADFSYNSVFVEEKIFFHPTDNSMKSIADTISYDAKSKKEWENKLMGLNKGHCIVYAQIKNKYDNLESLKPYYVSVDSIDK